MEPPTKKLRPYKTKWERQREMENTNSIKTECADHCTDHHKLFISDETVLEYQDKYYRNTLPRKLWKRLKFGDSPVWCVRWCTKFGHLLAVTCGEFVKLCDVMKHDDIRTVHSIKHNAMVRCCDWSRSSRQLLTSCYDGKINVHDFLTQGKISASLEIPTQPSSVKWWKDDDNLILVGGDQSYLASYDLRCGKETYKYPFKCGNILAFDFFKDMQSFMSSSDQVNRQSAEHNLIVWDLRMGAKISNQIFHERYTCPYIRVHPSGSNVMAQTTGNYIARFSTQKPYKIDKFVRYQNHTVNEFPVGFDISRDGHFVMSGSSNGSLVCYKHNNGNYMRVVDVNEGVSCIDVSCHPVMPSMVAVSDWGGNVHILT